MKKTISFIFAVLAVAVLSAAARPSLDGRAVVADDGEMPNGLFAKTIGYLPGDSVTVTNPANGSSVDVLILGSIDASEGVAILLSPQSADRLGIQKDANVQVKITKRTGSLDENVSGTAVLAQEDAADDYTGYESMEETESELPKDADAEDALAEADNMENDGFIASADEEDSSYIEDGNEENFADDSALSESEGEALSVSEVPEAEAVPVPELAPEEVLASIDPEPASAEDQVSPEQETDSEENQLSPEQEIDSAEEIVSSEPVPPAEREAGIDDPKPLEDALAEVVEEDEISPVQDEIPSGPAAFASDDGVASADEADDASSEELFTDAAPELDENSYIGRADDEPASNEENPAVALDAPSSEYAPIVLIPSEPYPPENAEEDKSEKGERENDAVSPVVENVQNEGSLQEVSESEHSVPDAVQRAVVAGTSLSSSEKDIEYYVKTENELETGKYYLQIASLGKKENIERVLEKYADKYPVVLIKLGSGNIYRVLVGPLSVDEYGMIKERFVSYGYKDAFLRKIK